MTTANSRSGRRRGGSGYIFSFVGAAALLVGVTLLLVLYVLPERYVLSSGFREGTLALPNPSTPFEPPPPLRIAALPAIPGGPGTVGRGPSEIFWERVLPLLEAERWTDAMPVFAEYLSRHPEDPGVLREYAITLAAAGYRDRAVPILRSLLEHEDDAPLHLLLARFLRDEGRVPEASEHYAILLERASADAEDAPDGEAVGLEWARALSWAGDYDGAEAVLREALERHPDSIVLRAELVRVFYFSGHLGEARVVLDAFSDEEVAEIGLAEMRAQIIEWLTPPPDTVAPPPLSTLERAVAAREADDFERADSLFQAALAEDAADGEAWQAYADFLQYEVEDFEGTLSALAQVESLRERMDPALEYRMAQLEIWTDRTEDARTRLEALLAWMQTDGARAVEPLIPPPETGEAGLAGPSPTEADVLALLGDLHRWDGERLPAILRYEAALRADPEHERANEGMNVLRDEVERQIEQGEEPGLGAIASTFADTDDFRRYDAGADWTGLHRTWVWSTRSGARRVEGLEPAGGAGSRSGLFAELEGARWWRWGTVRTALHLSVQNVRSSSLDTGLGASIRFVGSSGRRTDVRIDHEPAFASTNTLQSIVANVRQDRVAASHTQPLSERWSAGLSGELASLDHEGLPGVERNLRVQVGANVGRALSPSLTLGLAARALHYRDAAPDVGAVRLYWDPDLSVSTGPFLQFQRALGPSWELRTRVNPGLAWIGERGAGSELVPDLSGRLGFERDGSQYRTRVELFYGQGRFSGYRSFGVDVSFTALGFLGPGLGS